MGDEPAAKRPRPSGAALRLAARALRPEQLVFGGSWLAPGADDAADVGQDAADEAVAAAAAAGVREFDTAPWYGAGAGEERLGRAVAGLPASSGARIFTKTGRLVRMPDGVTPCTVGAQGPAFGDRVFVNDYTAEGAAASHADSLARLGADRVHGLRVHDPNDNSTWDGSTDEVAAALAPGGMLEGLRRLRAEGKIEHVSLGMNCHNLNGRARPEEVLRLLRGAPRGTFDSALLAGGWNLLTQEGWPCLLECQRQGIPVHLAGVFASGALVGMDRYAYERAPPEVVERTGRWRELAARHGVTLPALAVAFAALPTVVSRVVIGMASARQVEEAVSLLRAAGAVPAALWAEARSGGLLHEEVPLPLEEGLQVVRRALAPTELTFGGIWIGPGPDNGGEDLGQRNADLAVAAAVAAGVVDFDTAPWYGAGCAEERLGRAVARLPAGSGARVVTKVGRLVAMPDGTSPCTVSFEAPGAPSWKERVVRNDFTSRGAAQSMSESLARMGLSSVHGLRIHDPNDNSNYDGSVDEVAIALAPGGMLEGLRQLRAEGRIQHVGLGMNCNRLSHQGKPDEVLRLLRGAEEGTFDSALLAGGWNLLSQDGLPCLLECQRRGIEVHVAGVFGSGLLVGVDRYAYKAAPAEAVARAGRWRALATRHASTLPAVALAFAALPAVVSRVVLGMATPAQVEEAVALLPAAAAVPAALWREAREAGLLADGVPLPP